MEINSIRSDSRVGRSIAYVSIVGENIMQNFIDRKTRPTEAWRKQITKPVLDFLQIPEAEQAKYRLTWNQKAGCKCGCSPGFHIYDGDCFLHGKDIWVTVAGDRAEMVESTPEALAEQAERTDAMNSSCGNANLPPWNAA